MKAIPGIPWESPEPAWNLWGPPRHALGTLGTPADVAGAVAFLLGDGGRYITGQVLHVNGGMYM